MAAPGFQVAGRQHIGTTSYRAHNLLFHLSLTPSLSSTHIVNTDSEPYRYDPRRHSCTVETSSYRHLEPDSTRLVREDIMVDYPDFHSGIIMVRSDALLAGDRYHGHLRYERLLGVLLQYAHAQAAVIKGDGGQYRAGIRWSRRAQSGWDGGGGW